MKFLPWNSLAINAGRNLIALIILLPYLKVSGHTYVRSLPVLIGALSITGTNTLFTMANKLTTAGNAIILQFTAPVYAMLISALLYKKKPTRLDIGACLLVFFGILCFFVDGLSSGNLPGNALALLSGVSYAGVFLMNSSKRSDSFSSIVLGFFLNILIGLPSLLRVDIAATPLSAWTALFLLGVVQLGVAYIFLSEGLKTTDAVAASLITGIEPVLNPIWVALICGEVLTPLSLAGAAIVFLTILLYNVLKIREKAQAA